jgi:hypothetical protein
VTTEHPTRWVRDYPDPMREIVVDHGLRSTSPIVSVFSLDDGKWWPQTVSVLHTSADSVTVKFEWFDLETGGFRGPTDHELAAMFPLRVCVIA